MLLGLELLLVEKVNQPMEKFGWYTREIMKIVKPGWSGRSPISRLIFQRSRAEGVKGRD